MAVGGEWGEQKNIFFYLIFMISRTQFEKKFFSSFYPSPYFGTLPQARKWKLVQTKKNVPTKCCIDAINTRIQTRRSSADQISDPEVAVWNAQNTLKWMPAGRGWGEQTKISAKNIPSDHIKVHIRYKSDPIIIGWELRILTNSQTYKLTNSLTENFGNLVSTEVENIATL